MSLLLLLWVSGQQISLKLGLTIKSSDFLNIWLRDLIIADFIILFSKVKLCEVNNFDFNGFRQCRKR